MVFLKFFVAIVVVLSAVAGYGYAYISRDMGPTQINLKSADLPSIIPFHEFFADMNDEWVYRINPDGSKVAWHAAGFGTVNIKVASLADKKNSTIIKVGELHNMFWHPDGKRVVISTQGRLWAVDPSKPKREDWVDVTPRGFQNWWIVKQADGPDERIVIASRDRVAQAADLFTVNTEGGDKRPLIQNPDDVITWGLTADGDVGLRVRKDGEVSERVETRESVDSDVWNTVLSYNIRDSFFPILVSELGSPFYALSNRGRDLLALVKVDIATGTEEIIAQSSDGDITNAITLYKDSIKPDIIISAASANPVFGLSEAGKSFLEALKQDEKKLTDFEITAVSQSTRKISFRLSYDGGFWENKLFDPENNSIVDIGQSRFSRHNPILATSTQVRFDASDGLTIPAILTRPKTKENVGPLPTIINIHGGPASFEATGYRGIDQFLANRGYVVLSVNFRGSTGYGKAFRAAGYGELGQKMQSDISDAAKWLIAEGVADADNIAVMGGSYGGYSAALAMTRDPGLFKVGIVDYAVTDIPYQMTNNPFAWGLNLDEMKRYFGDPDKPEELEKMRERSPSFHANNVHGPILLSHGKLDNIVGFEQTENFARALKDAGKEFDVHYFEKEQHGYSRWQSKVVYWRRVENFCPNIWADVMVDLTT